MFHGPSIINPQQRQDLAFFIIRPSPLAHFWHFGASRQRGKDKLEQTFVAAAKKRSIFTKLISKLSQPRNSAIEDICPALLDDWRLISRLSCNFMHR
jgi:hypothetical protein